MSASIVVAGTLLWISVPLLRWASVDAVWQGNAATCRQAAGACWAFIREKHLLILFGLYPPDSYWRPIGVISLFIALFVLSGQPRVWGMKLAAAWAAGLAAAFWLM